MKKLDLQDEEVRQEADEIARLEAHAIASEEAARSEADKPYTGRRCEKICAFGGESLYRAPTRMCLLGPETLLTKDLLAAKAKPIYIDRTGVRLPPPPPIFLMIFGDHKPSFPFADTVSIWRVISALMIRN